MSAGGILAGHVLSTKVACCSDVATKPGCDAVRSLFPTSDGVPTIGAAFLSCPFVDLSGAVQEYMQQRAVASSDAAAFKHDTTDRYRAEDRLFAEELHEWGDPLDGGADGRVEAMLMQMCPTQILRDGIESSIIGNRLAAGSSQPKVILTTGEFDARVPAATVSAYADLLR